MKRLISKKQLREFGFVIGFGFPIFLGLLFPLIFGHFFRTWTLWIGIPFLLVSIFNPRLLFYPYTFWMKLGHILGWINSRIILGLIFILVLLPISFFMKIFNYDPLRKKKNNKKSYRENKENNNINLNRLF